MKTPPRSYIDSETLGKIPRAAASYPRVDGKWSIPSLITSRTNIMRIISSLPPKWSLLDPYKNHDPIVGVVD